VFGFFSKRKPSVKAVPVKVVPVTYIKLKTNSHGEFKYALNIKRCPSDHWFVIIEFDDRVARVPASGVTVQCVHDVPRPVQYREAHMLHYHPYNKHDESGFRMCDVGGVLSHYSTVRRARNLG